MRRGLERSQNENHTPSRARGTVADIPYINTVIIHSTHIFYSTHVIRPKTTVLVTNRVPVARFELKLSQNESYGLQEPF